MSTTTQKNSPYALLKTKEIIAILDGDTKYRTYEFKDQTEIPIMMPYLSGPDLCGLCTLFGLPTTYLWGGVNLSRWQYLDNLMIHCMDENRCSDLLAYLFDKKQFSKQCHSFLWRQRIDYRWKSVYCKANWKYSDCRSS